MDKFLNKYRIPSSRAGWWDYSSSGVYFITICTAHRCHYFGKISDGMMDLSPLGQIAHHFWLEIPDHFPIAGLDSFVVMPNHVHGILIISNQNMNGFANQIMETQNVAGSNLFVNQIAEAQNVAGPNLIADQITETQNVAGSNLFVNQIAETQNVAGSNLFVNQIAETQNVAGSNLFVNQIAETQNVAGSNLFVNQIAETQNVASLQGTANKNVFGPQSNNLASVIRGYKSGVTKFARINQIDFSWQSRFYDHIIRTEEELQRIRLYILNNPKNWKTDEFSVNELYSHSR